MKQEMQCPTSRKTQAAMAMPLPDQPEAQLCALAQSATDAKVLGCSITFTGLCKTCQQADKGSASK